LPSGRYQATVRHPSGRKITKTDRLKGVVTAWAAETEAALRNGEIRSERGRAVTVEQWHARWLAARNVAATTAHEEHLRWERYVRPQWGAWPLRSIGRIDVQAWVTKLGRERGAHVAFGCYLLLSKLLADAELEHLIPTTPCRKIDLPRIQKPAPRWLSREEYERLLLAFDGAPQGAQWAAMLAVACYSGLRSGELAGLDVGHVDFDRHQISVQQVMTKFGLREYPKSETSGTSPRRSATARSTSSIGTRSLLPARTRRFATLGFPPLVAQVQARPTGSVTSRRIDVGVGHAVPALTQASLARDEVAVLAAAHVLGPGHGLQVLRVEARPVATQVV
jgi:hypothetical protein